MRILIYIFGIIFFHQPNASAENMQRFLQVEFDETVRAIQSDPVELRRFQSQSVDEQWLWGMGGDFRTMLTQHLPEELLSQPNKKIKILQMEGCQINLNTYHPVSPNGALYTQALIVRARIFSAFKDSGINFKISMAAASNILPASGTVDSNTPIKSLLSLNTFLLKLAKEGKLDNIYQIVDQSEGCGAGEVYVSLDVSSDLDNFLYITEFYFRVCRKVVASPWNKDDCVFWRDQKTSIWASGSYRWQASRNSGDAVSGIFSVVDSVEDQTIVIK